MHSWKNDKQHIVKSIWNGPTQKTAERVLFHTHTRARAHTTWTYAIHIYSFRHLSVSRTNQPSTSMPFRNECSKGQKSIVCNVNMRQTEKSRIPFHDNRSNLNEWLRVKVYAIDLILENFAPSSRHIGTAKHFTNKMSSLHSHSNSKYILLVCTCVVYSILPFSHCRTLHWSWAGEKNLKEAPAKNIYESRHKC